MKTRKTPKPAIPGKPPALARAQHASGGAWSYTARGYALRQSLRELTTRKFSSLSTLVVLAITLALPTLFFFIADSLSKVGGDSLQEESLTLYLDLSVTDLEGAALANSLAEKGGVSNTTYISRDEALELLAAKSDVSAALSQLDSNPLPGAIVIYPTTAALRSGEVESLAENLGQIPEIARVQIDLAWIKRLQAVLSLLTTVGWILAGFLTLTALLVIGNTIRLELLRRRSEIEVSRLLGASRGFIQRPLLISGALYGMLAGVLACIAAFITLLWIRGPAGELSNLYASTFELKMPTLSQFLAVILLATALGLIGAVITLYRPAQQPFHKS